MANIKRLIPFGMMPGSWGLKGKTRQRAQAEYELMGEELDVALAKINLSGEELAVALEEISHKYNHQTFSEKERNIATITIHNETALAIKLLELDFNDGLVTEMEFNKKTATLQGEPWVNVIDMKLNQAKPGEGNFELDWNDIFIEYLAEAGYVSPNPEEVVDMWFSELCKNVALEAYDGVGDFSERVEEDRDGLTKTKKTKLADGKREFK